MEDQEYQVKPNLGDGIDQKDSNKIYPQPSVIDNPVSKLNDPLFADSDIFINSKIRHGFIKKVYSIVTLQLMVTFSFIIGIVTIRPIAMFFIENNWTLWFLLVGTFVIMVSLACFENLSRTHPINMILLMAFTVMESILLGCISTAYKTDTLIIAAGITALISIGLTLFAFQTKYDFTGFGVYLFVLLFILIIFSFLSIFMHGRIMELVYSCAGAALFSIYLIFDTQLMLGGKHTYAISPEDYIFAALNLYVDIINLFLLILRIVSNSHE